MLYRVHTQVKPIGYGMFPYRGLARESPRLYDSHGVTKMARWFCCEGRASVETAVMAKKKAKPAQPVRRPVAVTIKGNEEWKAWLEDAATHCRMSVSGLVDVAVTQYVKAQGFTKRPPER